MDPTDALARAPAVLELGGRRLVVLPPSPRDMLAVAERMRALARAKCVSPLDYVLRHTHLAPAQLALAVSEAIKLGAGGGAEPAPEAVWTEYASLDGVRWRIWYHASRAHADLKPEEVAALVTEDNLFDAAEALDRALKLADLDPKKKTPEPPPTGAPS
jgi:hypothetical protein